MCRVVVHKISGSLRNNTRVFCMMHLQGTARWGQSEWQRWGQPNARAAAKCRTYKPWWRCAATLPPRCLCWGNKEETCKRSVVRRVWQKAQQGLDIKRTTQCKLAVVCCGSYHKRWGNQRELTACTWWAWWRWTSWRRSASSSWCDCRNTHPNTHI